MPPNRIEIDLWIEYGAPLPQILFSEKFEFEVNTEDADNKGGV